MDPHSRAAKKIMSIKMKCYNKEVSAKIQQAIGLLKDPTIIKRSKLKWYGHVFCFSSVAKTILQGTVKGGRRQGRQQQQKKVGKLVVKSSVVPQ